jgi:transposase
LHAELQAGQYDLLKTQIRRLDHELRDRVLATPEAQRLVWVPGIGKMVAYTVLLEIDDIARFPTVRHFHSYCRLVPAYYGANRPPILVESGHPFRLNPATHSG